MMSKIKAVVFDMDGLLMDSEWMGVEAIHVCAAPQGYTIPEELCKKCIGINTKASGAMLREHFPGLDTERLFNDFAVYMHEKAVKGEIPVKKGVWELVRYLKEHRIPTAVASSSRMETIQLYLDSVGLTPYFDVLLSGSGMPSKPAPDVFLLAAEKLSVQPEDCLVLEDSYNGVKAGRAAGMTVGMVPDVLPYVDEVAPYVDHVLPDLTKVLELMEA